MTRSKRALDITIALLLVVVLAPLLLSLAIALLVLDGRPVLYISERMRGPQQSFALIKFRTMKPTGDDAGVSGADKAGRITPIGHFLRRTRLDELPQLWNVLRGDVSFVGPRPPLREYVERFPELYASVLQSRPGITGLASVYFHEHEEWLLSKSNCPEDTDQIYTSRCIPTKAKLDLIYQRRRNNCMDIAIMLKTVFKGLR